LVKDDDKRQDQHDRAAFDAEVRRKAGWLLQTLADKVAQGKLNPGVAVASLLVSATNLAQLHGIGPEVATWLRSQIPLLERMIAASDQKPN
jgi:hypothetical protein